MRTFWEWLLGEGRQRLDPAILAGYERAFKDQLARLIGRTSDPALRARLEEMLECPVRDSRGQCRGFADYIHSALIRNGIHQSYDLEAALQYVVEKMLLDRSEVTGQPRASLFGGFTPWSADNPAVNLLQARFMAFLEAAIRTIKKGRVPRLLNVERRPQGAVSIGLGRWKEGDPATGISPDEIADRPSGEAHLGELLGDIEGLLRRKEPGYGFPLAALFRAIMAGRNLDQQKQQFGDRRTRVGRQVIVQTIREYTGRTGNYLLLHLLKQFEDFNPNKPMPRRREPVKAVRPVLSDEERDYRSIASVIARFDHPIGTAQLGSFRRRWLEYPPRNPASGHRNRLEEVLAKMVRDGVLRAIPTRQGANVFGPGPGFDRYRPGQEA
jgi:hypothetical protein